MKRVALAASGLLAMATAAPPNIIMIITDDQDVEMGSLEFMPKLHQYIVSQGATFNNMYAAVPVCCPSRSALYSGRYQHNNHVVGNSIPGNCSSPAWQQTMEPVAFPTYLEAAGYATSFAGKYLNCYGFPQAGGVAHIPNGWTNWQGLVGNSVYYNYVLSNNGVAENHGNNYTTDYLPNLILNKTLDFIDATAGKQPFMALVSTPSCHGPADPAPQYADQYPNINAPRTPAFNALVNNTHWLQAVQAVYGLDANSEGFLDLVFRRRILTLQTVDDIIESLVNKLTAVGQLDNTYIIYSTDNGYHLGHYGFIYDKRQPWETDVHLPLFVRGPGIVPGTSSDAVVTMPDLSATVLDIAGVATPADYDGASVLPFVKTGAAGAAAPAAGTVSKSAPASATAAAGSATSRLMSLVEYHGETGNGGGNDAVCNKTSSSDLFCNPDGTYDWPPFWTGGPVCVCQDAANNTYSCLRVKNTTLDFRYCEFQDTVGTVEFFNYRSDPNGLNNLAPNMDGQLKSELSGRLAQATACVGTAQCNTVLTAPLQLVPLVEMRDAAGAAVAA